APPARRGGWWRVLSDHLLTARDLGSPLIRREAASSREITMTYPPSLWPPRLGDRVRVRASSLLGIVERIDGGDDQRFTLDHYGGPSDSGGGAVDADNEAQAANRAGRTYALDELEPAS